MGPGSLRGAALPLVGVATVAAALAYGEDGVIPPAPPAPLAGCARGVVALSARGEVLAGCRERVLPWLAARGCAAGVAAAARAAPGELLVLEEGPAGAAPACDVRVERLAGAARLALGLPVDVNLATAAELEALPGIGPGLAARIVADRARAGPFGSVEALDRVRGIGPATVARLRDLVTVGYSSSRDASANASSSSPAR